MLPFASKLARVVRPERGVLHPSPRLIKIALSATITRDPSKLAKLCLYSPKCVELILGNSALVWPICVYFNVTSHFGALRRYIEATVVPDSHLLRESQRREQNQIQGGDGEERGEEDEAGAPESEFAPAGELEPPQQRYVLPKKLAHLKLNCALEDKPLFAVALLCQLALSEADSWRCICFTSSLDSTFRLKLLLTGFKDSSIGHEGRTHM